MMSNPQRGKPPPPPNRDSKGNDSQHRLVDLANNKAPPTPNTNSLSGNAPSGPPSTSADMSSNRNSFSKDGSNRNSFSKDGSNRNSFSKDGSNRNSFTKDGSQSDSRPSTPQSQTERAPGGIDIPNAGMSASHHGSFGGGSSSSGGEFQSPSLMSVLNSPSSPPTVSYLNGSSPDPAAGAVGGSSGKDGSTSSDVNGATPGSVGLGQPMSSSTPSGFAAAAARYTSGEDGSSKEDDSSRGDAPPRMSTPDAMLASQSEPIFLKPGEVPPPFPDYQSPVREDRSPKFGKKKQKSSPWYSVLASTYKSKCEEFRRLFKTIPSNERLLMDYSCALQKDILVHGRMFITEGWLCFYANIFKWETMLTIRFKDVTAITKERTIRFIPNAIQISTDSEKYFFTSFMSREKSFLLLFRIWQNALLEQTMPSAEYWSWVQNNYGSDAGGTQGQQLPPEFIDHEDLDQLDNDDSTEDVSQSLCSEDQTSLDDVFPSAKDESQTDENGISITVPSLDKKTDGESALDGAADIGEVIDPLSSIDFGGKELINETFDIPVDKLFAALYGNQHPFMKKFLEFRKCTDIELNEWTRHDSDRDTRKVNYVLHLNTSLGYKACVVDENHIFQKNWSKTGQCYIVEKEVYNKNVPYCDYFYVHTLHVLTTVSPTSCRFRFIQRIEFLKSALGLVKTFIERNVESGTKQGEKELVKFIRDHLETVAPPKKRKAKKRRSQHPNRDAEEKRRTDDQAQPSTQQGLLSNLTPVWFQPNSESKLSLQSTMAFISVILAVLCVFNVSLFLQLRTLEDGAASRQVWSNAEFIKKLGELPKSEKDWTVLLQQQQQLHSREMQKWRDIVDLCIQLIKQMESTLSELHNGAAATDAMPSIQELLDSTSLEQPDTKIPIRTQGA